MAQDIVVRYIGDTSKLEAANRRVTSRMDKISRKLGTAGAALTRGVTLPLAGAAFMAGKLASDMGELHDFTRDVFKKNADEVIAWSETLIDRFGIGSDEALDFANRAGSLFNSTGLEATQSLDMIQAATQRVGDVASQTNSTVAEVAEAYQAGLKGNFARLDNFGVVVSAAAVQQKALEMGLADTTSELDAQDKQLAFHELFMERSSLAQGNFARTSESSANQAKTLQERTEKLAREFGENLLPIANKVLKWANQQAERFGALSEDQQRVVLVVGGLVAALGPLLSITAKAITVVDGLSRAFVWLAANPIVLVIAAVALLAVGLVILYKRNETFRRIVQDVWSAILRTIGRVVIRVIEIAQGMMNFWFEVWDKILSAAIKVMEILAPNVAEKLKGVREDFRSTREKANEQLDKIKKNVHTKLVLNDAQFRRRVNNARDLINKKIPDRVVTSLVMQEIAMGNRQGDGPGRGGSAIARARALAQGLPVHLTSSYRSPAHNARVGGSPTSFHMDRSNPAGDWGGPTWALDELHRRMVRAGGWRELIWRAPGHYDHVHAAEDGALLREPTLILGGETAKARAGGGEIVSPAAMMRQIVREELASGAGWVMNPRVDVQVYLDGERIDDRVEVKLQQRDHGDRVLARKR